MRIRYPLSLLFILTFFLGGLSARQSKGISNFEITNLKTRPVLKTLYGKIEQRTGIARYLYDLNITGYQGTAEQIARQYLLDNAKRFGIQQDKAELKTIASKVTRGGSHVFFDQQINGIPVHASRISVNLNNRNAVTFIANNYRPIPAGKTLPAKPAFDEQQAIEIARAYLGVSGRLLGPERAALMYFESADRGFELSWRVIIPTEQPLGDWEIFVNALDKRIIQVRDMRMTADGQGMIWDPDPLTTAGVEYGGNYKDNNDTDSNYLNDERITATLRDITYQNNLYKLEGPYAVLADLENPADAFPELADSSAFNFTRAQQEFEDVMVYYHIDLSTRHLILDLGYDEAKQHNFQCDPHGLSGDDNSHYMTSENYVAFGEGGVDDGEDADVIWHEHAHSFQTNLTGGMSYSGETQSLQEGSSDYWAASYSRIINDYNWGYVFSWDGHNEFWAGRRCDLDWVYPDDYVSGHDGGQIWSSALMDIWADLGRDLTDELFIETHYIWGYSPGLQDAAAAFIQADENLYGGAHKSVIVEHFDAHGLVDKADYMPTIVHTPLKDTEDTVNGYDVIATITPGNDPLDPNKLWVVHGLAALTDTLLMTPTGNTDEYSATIPAAPSNSDIYYYINAVDQANGSAYDPVNAPTDYHSFHVGPDTVNPVISHTPLSDQTLSQWPATVSATVTDNMGVDTVICYYNVNHGTESSFPLVDQGNDVYSGDFPIASSSLNTGDSIFYYITARDISQSQLTDRSPDTGYYGFEIVDSRGYLLIINDDGTAKTEDSSGKPAYKREKTSYGKSATTMQNWLNQMGFTTESMTVAQALNADFTAYDLIISSSGANTSPVSDQNYRDKLENWVSDPAHKLFIEGGELGYDAIKSPGYPTFASNVLHANVWDTDNSGSLNQVSSQSNHPLATTPNILPSSFAITYAGYGDEDAVTPEGVAYIVYGTNSYANDAGILVYDDNTDTTSAQIVYFAFNFDALNDSSSAKNLLENTVEYLLTDEGPISALNNAFETKLPRRFELQQNYPNPFNPKTHIRYQIPEKSRVKIAVYNALGQKIAVLVDKDKPAGSYSVTFNGNALSSGLYIVKMQAGKFVQMQKMILLK